MCLSRHLLIGLLLCAAPAWAQDAAVATLGVQEAADLAGDLKVEASAVELDAQSEAEQMLQGYVDQIATLATLLETEMRAGADKGDTQELYRELRRIRLDVLELVRSGKVELPPDSAERFEKLMNELGSYYAGAPAPVSAEAASPGE